MTRRVRFNGQFLWFHEHDDGSGPLAPLDHCDGVGEIKNFMTALTEVSYAYVFAAGEIKRYGVVIGHYDDLEEA